MILAGGGRAQSAIPAETAWSWPNSVVARSRCATRGTRAVPRWSTPAQRSPRSSRESRGAGSTISRSASKVAAIPAKRQSDSVARLPEPAEGRGVRRGGRGAGDERGPGTAGRRDDDRGARHRPHGPAHRAGRELRRRRERARISREAAGDALRASPAKISRLELGRVGFKERDVLDLLTLYGVDDPPSGPSSSRWPAGRTRPGWWHRYSDLLPGGSRPTWAWSRPRP